MGQMASHVTDKPIEMISSESVDTGNDTITIQPESPKSDRDEFEEIIPQAENDVTEINSNEFYMPSENILLFLSNKKVNFFILGGTDIVQFNGNETSLAQFNVSGRGRMIKNQDNPKAKHQCDVCLKRFVRPAELLRHVRIHTGEKELLKYHFQSKFHIVEFEHFVI